MTKHFLPVLILVFVLLTPGALVHAADWGILTGHNIAEIDSAGNLDNFADGFAYTGNLIPWVSIPFGSKDNPNGSLYISAGFTLECSSGALFIPELLRTEFGYRFGGGTELHLGRMHYSDPLGFIASGLFDGAQVNMALGGFGNLGIGAWYTGLLYKKNARITMTGHDAGAYYSEFEYADFLGSYFAPRRIMAAIDWEKPDLSEKFRLIAAIVGQADVSGRDELYHNQYLEVKFVFPFSNFALDFGGALEFAEHTDSGDTKFEFSAAGEIEFAWFPATKVQQRLMLIGRFSSGTLNSSLTAFVPITMQFQGDILRAKLSGLSMIRLDYTMRPVDSLILNLADSYFILSDLGTYFGNPIGRDGHFLGNEISASVSWSPLSDLQLRLMGGVFLPSWGNADKTNKPLWRVELTANLVIF